MAFVWRRRHPSLDHVDAWYGCLFWTTLRLMRRTSKHKRDFPPMEYLTSASDHQTRTGLQFKMYQNLILVAQPGVVVYEAIMA